MLIIFLLFFLFFFIHTYLVIHHKWDKIDHLFYNKIKIKEPKTVIFKFLTNFASTFYFVVLSVILLFLLKDKKIAFAIILGLIVDSIIIYLVKHIIKRERPNINRLVYEKGYSYISGHTFSATFFYGLVAFFVFLSTFSLPLKIFFIVFLFFFILIIAFSRVYLGVHYLSDTIGGFCLGISYLMVYVFFTHVILNIF